MTDSQSKADLAGYLSAASQTDVLDSASLSPIMLGLAGETGDAVAAAKKMIRDSIPDPIYRNACIEELGDLLWYLAAAARRLSIDPVELRGIQLAMEQAGQSKATIKGGSDCSFEPAERALLNLVYRTGQFTNPENTRKESKTALDELSIAYSTIIQTLGFQITTVAHANLIKIQDYFGPPDWGALPDLDRSAPDERIPRYLDVQFVKRSSGKTHMMISNIFVGDPLDDNVLDHDFYRLHDVFHLANAFLIGWSPVIRALLKRKRKSKPGIDGTEDSGRAVVIEEAIVAYVFAQAQDYSWFHGRTRIPLDILKNVHLLTKGYEASQVPLWAWSECFIQGYDVFQKLKDAGGVGMVTCNANERKLSFRNID